ncbi:MAG TPA: hypothetical protein PKA64_23845, partial [Myxococcota bacterium]|nr:hypothetical protein [Myxococcota bacterium]
AVQARPELAAVVADEVARGYAAQPAPHEPYADALRAWGQLPDADMASVGRQVFDQVVVHCAVALLGPGHGAVAVAV